MQDAFDGDPFVDPLPAAPLTLEARIPGTKRYIMVRFEWCCDDKATVSGFGRGGWMKQSPCTVCNCPRTQIHVAPAGSCNEQHYELTQLEFQREALARARGEVDLTMATELPLPQAGQLASLLSLSAGFVFQTSKVEHSLYASRSQIPKALHALNEATSAVMLQERKEALEQVTKALLPYRENLRSNEQKAIYLSVGNAEPLRRLEAQARKTLVVAQATVMPSVA
eukprot:4069591-Prymnesium_polylepis.1